MADSLRRAVARLGAFFRREPLDHDLEEEVASHIAMATEDNIRSGMTPEEARRIVGPERIVGISTHNAGQLEAADLIPVDYIAIGPVFATSSKQNPDPFVGL